MSTQRPHHISSQNAGGNIRIANLRPMTNYAKRTHNKTQAKGLPPLYLTPTEVGDIRPPHQKYETNPISSGLGFLPRLCVCNYAKRTQFQPRRDPLFTIHCSLFTIFTKRTQFTPPTPSHHHLFCKTNPISAPTFCKTNPISGPPDEILRTND